MELLKNSARIGAEYTLEELNTLLTNLATGTPLNTPGKFDLSSKSSSYNDLVSSSPKITIKTYIPEFNWDPIFLEIYGPMVVRLAARIKLPPAPNRWLVIRNNTDNPETRAWVVESDRLTPPEDDGSPPAGAGTRAIPGEFDASFVEQQTGITPANAFEYLGFYSPAQEWSEDKTARRLTPLTAAGHGVPDFAAFYPNCQGVFGFHDSTADASAAYEYTVMGWYSDPAQDPLSRSYTVSPWATQTSEPAERIAAMGWAIKNPDWNIINSGVYTAKIKVTSAGCAMQAASELAEVDVAIGNTAGEALAAYIADDENQETLGLSPESILNAAQAGVLSKALSPDGPAIIENALHEHSFQAEAGGWVWQITNKDPLTPGLSASVPTNSEVEISDTLARALNELNQAQIAFDRAQANLQTERRLAFSDWCNALHLYTDAANTASINGNTESKNNGQDLNMTAGNSLKEAVSSIQTASVGESTDTSMLPYQALKALYLAHYTTNQTLAMMPEGAEYRLRRQPAPRYYRPNDPVIMMTEKNGQDLQSLPSTSQVLPPDTIIKGRSYLTLQVITPGAHSPAWLPANWDNNKSGTLSIPPANWIEGAFTQIKSINCAQSWRPFSLNWAADFYNFADAGGVTATAEASETADFLVNDYTDDFITANFQPDKNGIELLPKTGVKPQTAHHATYNGRVILSSHALQTMRARILQLTGQTANAPKNSAGLKLPGALGEGVTKRLIDGAYDNAAQTLSQTLNGFNDRLLMLERSPQISLFDTAYTSNWNLINVPPWDPVSQSFYNEIGLQNRISPNTDDIYNPIRAGKCEITALTLVDAFGQIRHWKASSKPANTIISETLPNETADVRNAAPAFLLPPRLSQAARLLFRWLSADGSDDAESNQSPATTPVCGWVALNRLDENIMIFLQDGALLGWVPARGGKMTYLPDKSAADITDPYLKQVVEQIQNPASTFFEDINTALLTIEPGSHRTRAGRSILESRPLALARAALQLQLSGAPSPHQGYESYGVMKLDGANNPLTGPAPSPYIIREDCGFTGVHFPLRPGDVSMDDDGLVLYWTLKDDTIAQKYTLVEAEDEADPDIKLPCGPNTPPTRVLLLLDPRAPVHISSGILPVKEISIPPQMYAEAVRNMEYMTRVDPILTPADTVALPLPAEIRGTWSWVYNDGDTLSSPETPQKTDDKTHPTRQPAVFRRGFLKASADE